MSTDFQFHRIKSVLEIVLHNDINVLNTSELYIQK